MVSACAPNDPDGKVTGLGGSCQTPSPSPSPSPPDSSGEVVLSPFRIGDDSDLAAELTPSDATIADDEVASPEILEAFRKAGDLGDLSQRLWPWASAPVFAAAAGGDVSPRPASIIFTSKSTLAGPLAQLGMKLGRYELGGLLGRGGHGLVFRANDPALKRTVAIKVPSPESVAAPSLRDRFLREAQAVARLDHPGIVSIHDVGQAGMVVYLVSALVPGVNLADWIRERTEAVPPREAAELALKLTEAIAHAHSRGVLHRDLKPSNVLLEAVAEPQSQPNGDHAISLVPRITDFGLAEILDEDDEPRLRFSTMGTPRFMAPEQATAGGSRIRIGPQADVYALGAILHVLLMRKPPHGPLADSEELTLDRPDVSETLRAIVARCLRLQPEARYQTAEALVDDLRRFLDGGAAPQERPEPRRRGRRLGLAAGLAMSFSAISVAFALAAVGWHRTGNGDGKRALTPRSVSNPEPRGIAEAASPRASYIDDIQVAGRVIANWNDILRGEQILDRWAGVSGPGDPRGFEWGYLKRRAHREALTLLHELRPDDTHSAVYHVRFAPNGRSLASAGQDHTVRFWDVSSGNPLGVLRHTSEVNWVSISPDGRLAATACDDSSVWVWEIAEQRVLHRFDSAHSGKNAVCVEFSPDGKRLICGGRDKQLVLRDVASGRIVRSCDSGLGEIESLAVIAVGEGGLVVAGGKGGPGIVAFDIDLKSCRALPGISTADVMGVAIAPGGRLVAGTEGGEVRLWDLSRTSAEPRSPLRCGLDRTYSMAFDPTGARLAVVGGKDDPTVQIWDVADRVRRDVLTGHSNRIWCVTFSPDGKTLATASDDGTVKIHDLVQLPHQSAWDYPRTPAPLAFVLGTGTKPGSKGTFRIARENGSIDALDLENGEIRPLSSPLPRPIDRACFSADGRFVATRESRPGGALQIRDLERGGALIEIPSADLGGVSVFNLSSDGGLLAVADHPAGLIRLIAPETLTEVRRFPSETVDFERLLFSPAGRFLVGVRQDAHRWDLDRGIPVPSRASGGAGLNALAFSPDGRVLAIGGNDRTVQILDAESMTVRATLYGHRQSVNSLAFSPDGRRLASGEHERVHFWDVAGGKELLTLRGPSRGMVQFLAFTPDGKTLVAVAADDRIIAWHSR